MILRSTPGTSAALRPQVALVLVAFLAASCSEERADPDGTGSTTTSTVECEGSSVVECAPEGVTFAEWLPDEPVAAEGEPIRIGMINTDSGPAAAYPEITKGARAGVDWANAELGGVDGRPIELVTCDTQFSPTGSLSCAQRMVEEDVVAVMGGIDVFGDAVAVLEENGIPLVGGIPVNDPAAESPMSFQFSGGTWGLNLGFVHHMVEELGVERVSIMYGDFGPIADGAMWAKQALIGQGLSEDDVNMVAMPMVVEDVLTPLQAADETDPDAIVVLVADAACTAASQAILETGVDAQTYWSGGCLLPSVTEAIGAENLEGNIYAVESPLDPENPDVQLYNAVVERYGVDLEAGSVATSAFYGWMNLYDVMRTLGADGVSSEAIVEQLQGAVDHPAFGGHPYTCDGQQMGGELPAICAPQQILAQMHDGQLEPITDWIDVAAMIGPEE
jgi:branched-chain amino acid transport system substrate-binding protein